MMNRWILKNGHVVDPRGGVDAVRDILIENGKVREVRARLARQFKGIPSVDAQGRWVWPGPVDMHVHLREPGGNGETIKTGAQAATCSVRTTGGSSVNSPSVPA